MRDNKCIGKAENSENLQSKIAHLLGVEPDIKEIEARIKYLLKTEEKIKKLIEDYECLTK